MRSPEPPPRDGEGRAAKSRSGWAAPVGGGIDAILREDVLGLDAIYVQAKRYAEDNTLGPGTLSNPRIRA